MNQAEIRKRSVALVAFLTKWQDGEPVTRTQIGAALDDAKWIAENSKKKRTSAQKERRAALAARKNRPAISDEAKAKMQAKLDELRNR